ncbi:UNKNOWN [Stylonychia lemnae]|uniref:Uncharacterized protein n=1 Tax=Stylonychia lemnae TaxID=5949 RepID=A0A078A7E0_STYLE|nr:UNKNOWN [Stylonychia lemnae]|eukprot:CDW78164.1 UNKNOWN [Stylonychia lemnae]
MKRISLNRLKQEATKFDSLKSTISTLEDQGKLQQLFDIILSICSQERAIKSIHQQLLQSCYQNKNPSLGPSKNGKENKNNINNDECNIDLMEDGLKDNLKLIMQMMIDDIWKNYDSYTVGQKVQEQRQNQQSALSGKKNIESMKQSRLFQEQRISVASSTFNRDFIEPVHHQNKKVPPAQSRLGSHNQHQQQQQQHHQVNHLIIDDISSSDMSDQSMINPATAAAISEDKENLTLDQIANIKHQNSNGGGKSGIFNYNSNNTDYGQQHQQIHVKPKKNWADTQTRRHTENHHYLNSNQFRLQSESELLLSQFQTPQYKQSEIGNPISSPHTDERDSLIQQQRIAKQKLLGINLLSQENSAKDSVCHKKQQRILSDNFMTSSQADNRVMEHPNLSLADLDSNQRHHPKESTPQHLLVNAKSHQQMEEIMLKNIWEIENNPIFSSGGSISDEKEFTNMDAGVVKQFKQESFKAKQSVVSQNKRINYQKIDLDSDDQLRESDVEIQIDNYSRHSKRLEAKPIEKNQRHYDGPIQIDDDSEYNNEDGYSNNDGTDEQLTNQYITRKQDYTSSQHQQDVFSESRVPVTSIDGHMPKLNYQAHEGVEKKISKLNLNQGVLQSQPNLLFQFQQQAFENEYENSTQQLVMDQQYLKNIPKTGRDHYTNKSKQNHTQQNLKQAVNLLNSQNNLYNTTQDSNSLMLSSDQPTKISAEEVIRNYTNANFMPQKQASDRLHLLCQSRELNPLVSLSVENDDENGKHHSPHKLKLVPQTARVNSQNKLVDSNSKKKKQDLLKESLKYQQMKNQGKRENQNQAPKQAGKNTQLEIQCQIASNQNNQQSLQQSQSRSTSRSKTPLNARPMTSQSQIQSRNIAKKQYQIQQCMTQGNIMKKDDSGLMANESKLNNYSLINKLASSTEHERRLTTSASQQSSKQGNESKYIVNKLAKVIKSKVGTSSSQSRNSMKKQSSTAPLNNYENFLNTNNSNQDNIQVNYLGTNQHQINVDYSNQALINKAILNNSSGPYTNSSASYRQGNNQVNHIAFNQVKGNHTTKFQQFTLSQQRTDSQQSLKSTQSQANHLSTTNSQIHPNQSQLTSTTKINKFSMRRFTADATNDESQNNNYRGGGQSQQQINHINSQTQLMNMTQLSSNVLANIGQSNSSKNLNQSNTTLTSNNNLPPHQRSMVHLHQNQGTISPQQIIRQMKQQNTNDNSAIITSSGSAQGNQNVGSSNTSSLGSGTGQIHLQPLQQIPSKGTTAAQNHKNVISNTAAAQAIIYGKLIKKQRKKIDLC